MINVTKNLYDITINYIDSCGTQLFDVSELDFHHKGLYIGITKQWNEAWLKFYGIDIPEFDKSKLNSAKIYRFPHLALPREKVNIINKKYDSQVIRDKEKADIAIVSEKYFGTLNSSTYNTPNYTSKKDLLHLLHCNVNQPARFTDAAIVKIKQFLDTVNDDDQFCVSKPYYYHQGGSTNSKKTWLESVLHSTSGGYVYYIEPEQISNFNWLKNNQHLLCLDSVINNVSSEDSTPLNEENYSNIVEMIKSDYVDDRSLGVEIMANCNTEESYTYLAMLFFFHSDDLKETKNWNYVNFKSLRIRFENYIHSSYFGSAHPYDNLIKKLVKDDALTEFAVQIIAKNMFNSVLNGTFGIDQESVFKIDPSSLILKDEYKKKITAKNVKDLELDVLPF